MIRQLYHYWLIRHSGLFDPDYYYSHYPEVNKSGLNPILHFLKDGWKLGYNPSPHFDTQFYLDHNPDVVQSGTNPLAHYIKWGRKEGRHPNFYKPLSYPNYQFWIKKHDTLDNRDKIVIRLKIKSFLHFPKFTIFMFILNKAEKDVQTSIKSIQDQLYKKWQLRIITNQAINDIFARSLLKKINNDSRINILTAEGKPDFSLLFHELVNKSSGDFVGVIDPSDTLSPHALYLVAEKLNKVPDSHVLYSDEDQLDHNGNRCDPFFKPEWNPDLFLTNNYFSGLTLIRKTTIKNTGTLKINNLDIALWDLFLRITDSVDSQYIQHIPFILCHRRIKKSNEYNLNFVDNFQTYKKMILSHLQRVQESAEIIIQNEHLPRVAYIVPKPEPLVSIIIPMKDQHKLLSNCLDSIQKTSQYDNKEIIIINNQSRDPKTLDLLTQLSKNKHLIRVIQYNRPFNFSAINNYAVNEANGSILFFLNNDIEALTPGWINEMAGHAIRPEIGAVGAMLYYPDDTIQHAGIILLDDGVAGHAYQNKPRGYKGQRFRAFLTQNVSAVTGACLAIEKKKFMDIGGFDETRFPIAFNDVDLCLRLKNAGYQNLWTPHAEFYHHESASRGYDITPEKIKRLMIETDRMRKKWGKQLNNDPAYNPNLSQNSAQFSLAFPPRVPRPWWKSNE